MSFISFLDSFCGEVLWDDNVSWNTTNPILSRCFRQTALGILPCLVYWVLLPIDLVIAIQSRLRPLIWSWLNIARLTFAISVALLHFVELITFVSTHPINERLADFYAPLVKVVSFVGMTILLLFLKKKGVVTSGSSWFFSVVMTFFDCINVYHAIKDRQSFNDTEFVLSFLIFVVTVLLMITCSIVDEPCLHSPNEEHSPREFASFPSMLTFWWFTSMAKKGYKQALTTADLFNLRREDRTQYAGSLFMKNWIDKKKMSRVSSSTRASMSMSMSTMKNDEESSVENGSVIWSSSKETTTTTKGVGVVRVIWRSYGGYMLVASVFKLCHDTLQFVNPRLLKWLIQYIGDYNEPFFHGLMIVFLMFLVSNGQSIFIAAYFDRMAIAATRIRSGLMTMIYEKAMRLKNSERKDTTVGEIVNLMAVDTQRITDIMMYVNLLWSAPFQIIVGIYCIYLELGIAVFGGVAVVVIVMPINAWLFNMAKRLQQKQMKLKDERVKMMNEVLNGATVIKLHAWEQSFIDVVLAIRNREIFQLKLMSYLYSVSLSLWSCIPFVFALVSFAIFVLIDERNVLDAEKAFVSLTYFNIIQFPLIMLPNIGSRLMVTWVSIKRLNKYLNARELDDYVERVPNGPAVKIADGSFSWDEIAKEQKDARITLENINLSIDRGSLVAVVGSVGSGKSSLVSAILGEMEKIAGRVVIGGIGKIAYVPQQAWMQNRTLKENIVFGCELDEKRYQRIIDVCELKPDLALLPAGDETEIGEKGINLSGGQKQRVNLARACYSNCDLYLLDDPLSAVDSHVATIYRCYHLSMTS